MGRSQQEVFTVLMCSIATWSVFNIFPHNSPGPDRFEAVVPDVRGVRPGGRPHRRHPLLLPLQAQAPAQQVVRRREDGIPARTEGDVLV